jgi:hypothetical protein
LKEREIIDFAKNREELKSASVSAGLRSMSSGSRFFDSSQNPLRSQAERHGDLQMSVQRPDEASETLSDGAADRCIRVNSTIRIPL